MSPILVEALAAISAERPRSFNRSFRLVDELLREYSEAGLADRLASEIPPEVPWELVVDLLDILAWSTSDNGAALQRAAERWLRAGDDPRRVLIALHLEVYPFLDRAEMEEVLRRIAARYPELAPRCEELIESRRNLAEGGVQPNEALQRTRCAGR